MSINYDLWPNPDGQLGKNKVQIPDGVTTTWPEGDAFVGNFIYKDGLLSGFVDYKALVANESKTSTIPYDYAKITLDKSLEGTMTFNGDNAKYFTVNYVETSNSGDTIVLGTKYVNCRTVDEVVAIDSDYKTNDIVDGVWIQSLEKLEKGYLGEYGGCGNSMFEYCSNLTTFTSDLSSLTDGNSMFWGCNNLTTFTSDLSSLTRGGFMFHDCSNLTNFTSDLSSLTYGDGMFGSCHNLTSFTSVLSSLTSSYQMFLNCSNLTNFTSDLSSLTYGDGMFWDCSNLTTFTSNLSSLTYGNFIFYNCKLDTASIKNIAETINTVTNRPSIHIGIGNTSPTAEENTYLTQIHNRGWQVYVNGHSNSNIFTPTAITPIDGEEQQTPIPFWAKPVPATEGDAQYVDADGNFYNILGGQFIFVDDPETYGMFTSLEDAAANMRLKKIGEEEIETA